MPSSLGSTFIAPLLDALSARPTSVVATGANRVTLTRVAVGLAQRLDREFQWFDIREHTSAAPAWQRSLEDGIPPGHVHAIDVPEMQLDRAGSELATSERPLAPPVGAFPGLLDDLSRIPESIQRAAVEGADHSTPRVILLTNVERASAAFDGALGSLRPYITALNQVGVTTVVTACGHPRENRHDFDLEVVVEGPRDDGHAAATVVCVECHTAELFPTIPPGSRYASDSFTRAVS